MDLVEIDHVDGEAAEAVFDFAPDRISAQYFLHIALGIPAQATLGEDVRPWSRASSSSARANHFFGVPQTVDGGRVDPVDAEFERSGEWRRWNRCRPAIPRRTASPSRRWPRRHSPLE